jgi:spermidine synthase
LLYLCSTSNSFVLDASLSTSSTCELFKQRIAIIGGGEGATLREVLKHRSVTHVKMLEIDEELVHISKDVLPEWSDCGDILMSGYDDFNNTNSGFGERNSCFDDNRVDVQFVDAFQWFIDSYGLAVLSTNTTKPTHSQELFDVIIMDALDPDDFISFADKLYNNTPFIRSLSHALSHNGVFIVQLGASPDASDPSDESGSFRNRANMIERLVEVGFESIHIYEEGHCDFFHPWSVLVAFKNYEMRANWHRHSAEIEIQLQKRIQKTKSGRQPLFHFDAATMMGYQIPSKSFESVYCRQEDAPEECDEYFGFWPDIVNIPISQVKVQKSTVSDRAGRGIFAVNGIPEESMIDLDQGTKAFHIAPSTWEVFDSLYEWSVKDEERGRIEDEISALKYFIEGEQQMILMLPVPCSNELCGDWFLS